MFEQNQAEYTCKPAPLNGFMFFFGNEFSLLQSPYPVQRTPLNANWVPPLFKDYIKGDVALPNACTLKYDMAWGGGEATNYTIW